MPPAQLKTPFFLSVDAFENNYAGKSTPLLESQAIERAGRQDGFCVVCKKAKPEAKLFPQVGPGQIHFCPRRFCEDCCVIQDDWKRDLRVMNTSNDRDRYKSIPVCCSLCIRRGWQNVCPFLGPGNPEWEGRDPTQRERISTLRYKTWETKSQQDPDRRKLFQQRPVDDDGSLESDCQILQGMKDKLLKPEVEFIAASPGDTTETSSWKTTPAKARMLDTFIIFQIAYNYLTEELEPDFVKNDDYGFGFGGLSSQPKKKIQPGRSSQKSSRAQSMQNQAACCRCRESFSIGTFNDNQMNAPQRDFLTIKPKLPGISARVLRFSTTPVPLFNLDAENVSPRQSVSIHPNNAEPSSNKGHLRVVTQPPMALNNPHEQHKPSRKRQRDSTLPDNGVESPNSSDSDSFNSSASDWTGADMRESMFTRNIIDQPDRDARGRTMANFAFPAPAAPSLRSPVEKRHPRHRPTRLHLGDVNKASPAQLNNPLPTPLGTPTETPSLRASFSSAISDQHQHQHQSARLAELEQALANLAAENMQLKTDAVSMQQCLSKLSALRMDAYDLQVDNAILGQELSRRLEIGDDVDEVQLARHLREKSGTVREDTVNRLMDNDAFRGLFRNLSGGKT